MSCMTTIVSARLMSRDDGGGDGWQNGRLNHQHYDAIGLYVMTEVEDFDN